MTNLSVLEQRLGYSFANRGLLTEALTHRSFGKPHNERLEFLGDSVLATVISKSLFEQLTAGTEGQLSTHRAALVCGSSLAIMAQELDLAAALKLGSGEEKTGGRERESNLANALEAVIGAIYLDAGFERVQQFILQLFSSRLQNLEANGSVKDAKSALQEHLQALKKPLPQYEVVEVKGEGHALKYTVSCSAFGLKTAATATASSRKKAEMAAAQSALQQLGLLNE